MRGDAVSYPSFADGLRGVELVEQALATRHRGEAGMSVRLGINPITWTNDDVPELGGDTPLETCLAETRLAGYAGTELGGKFPRSSDELRAVLAEHGLALVSGWYDGRILEREVAQEFDAVLPHLTLLRDLGCRHVVYADTSRRAENDLWGPISRRPRLAAEEWPAYGAKLTALAERMAAFGVGMAFHHHMGTIVESDEEVGLLMAAYRARGRPALRHRSLRLRRRRSRGAGPAPCRPHRPRPLQGHAPRPPGPGSPRRSELHAGRGRRHLHRPGRRQHRLSDHPEAYSPTMAMPAGWWSRPSRTRPRPIP